MHVLFSVPCDSLPLSPVTYPSATLIGAYGCHVVAMLLPYCAPLGSNWAPSGLQEATIHWQTGLATCPTSPFKLGVRNASSVAACTVCHAPLSCCTCRVGVIWTDCLGDLGCAYCTSSLTSVYLAVQLRTFFIFYFPFSLKWSWILYLLITYL